MDALDVVFGTGVPFVARVVLAVSTCGLTMSSPVIKGLRCEGLRGLIRGISKILESKEALVRTNCRKLTPFGRRLLVDRVLLEGWPAARAAEAAGVSRQTAYRWVKRWREEGEPGLQDRSPRPHHSPNRVSLETEDRIVSDRITEKEGPHLMAGRLGVPRSTIYRVLARRGLSRLLRPGPDHRDPDPL